MCENPLDPSSFLRLKSIHVDGCNALSNVFYVSSVVRFLPNLTDLDVTHCIKMEEIFAIEEQPEIQFPHLRYIKLSRIEALKSFCSKVNKLTSNASSSSNSSFFFTDKVCLSHHVYFIHLMMVHEKNVN